MRSTENEGYNPEFLNKKVVITGASSGIGRALATYFLNSGSFVVLVGRDVESMKLICKSFNNHCTIIECDLTKDIKMFDLKTSVIERCGTIDILINAAGILLDNDITNTVPEEFDIVMNINLRSVYILIKSFEKFYSKNASIVNISCLYGNRPMQGLIAPCMSKAGLEALTRCAAAEYASLGVRVNCVCPCPVQTNFLSYAKCNEKEMESLKEKMKKNIPLGRIAYPDDVAKAVLFLCSERSSAITGQVIRVDGGRNLTSSGYTHYFESIYTVATHKGFCFAVDLHNKKVLSAWVKKKIGGGEND